MASKLRFKISHKGGKAKAPSVKKMADRERVPPPKKRGK